MAKDNNDNIVLNHHQLMLLIREYEKCDKEACLTFYKKINDQFNKTNFKYLKQDRIFIEKSDYDSIIKKIKIDPLDAACCDEQIESIKSEEKIIKEVFALVYTTKGSIQISDDELSAIIDSMSNLNLEEKKTAKDLLLKDQTKRR